MNAHRLLENIEARGGVATVHGKGHAAKISVAPRSVAREFLSDLQRFKPSLLELLEAAPSPDALRHAAPDEGAQSIGKARLRLKRLDKLRGSAGACRAIWRASRRLEREQGDFWRRLSASERHALAVCVALFDEKS